MPFKAPEPNPKCPKCGRSVYAAEERLAGGQKWHKTCFKCGVCNKMLDSTNCTEHNGELFCKTCHGRNFGPKGYGFGGGAGCLSMDTGEQEGSVSAANSWQAPNTTAIAAKDPSQACPRCGGAVFEAEKILAKGRSFHKTCFKCKACHKYLDSTIACDGPDHDVYCKVCYGKQFGLHGYGYGLGAGVLQSDECLMNGDQYLANKPHLIIDTTSIMAIEGQDACPRCGGAVFEAEKVLAKGRPWHKKCFKCCECTKTLDSMNACDGPDRDVYCKTCYGKKYGPKGYGFSCGSGFLQTDVLPNEENDTQRPAYTSDCSKIKPTNPSDGCPRCGGAVYEAEKMLAKGAMWHKTCFNCNECRRPLDSILACDGPDREIYCKPCYGKRFGPKGYGYGASPCLVSVTGESTAPAQSNIGGIGENKAAEGEGCGRCGGKVFEAEKMLAKSRVWHRGCFYCSDCRRGLDSTNLNDGPDGDIYCKGCYARKFGPKGVGYGIGAGALQMIQ